MDYRRIRVKGATYFFTLTLEDRTSTLLTDNWKILRSVIHSVKRRHAFKNDAMVVLPDHLHALWTLPPDDHDYPLRWALIKAGFSRLIPVTEWRSQSRMRRGERGIWQRRYWEHRIRDERDLAHHMDYIHYNPVKHGYVEQPTDWPYSSLHRFIANGVLPADWASNENPTNNTTFVGWGERSEPQHHSPRTRP